MNYLLAKDIAKDLGLSLRTIQKYLADHILPSRVRIIKGKATYCIDELDYLDWKHLHFKGVKRKKISIRNSNLKPLTIDEIEELKIEWLDWCLTGKLTGKPLSPRTVEIYDYYFGLFLQGLGRYPSKPLISSENLRKVVGQYPVESYSTKRNIYDSVMSITKFLIEKKQFQEAERNEFKKFKPKRFLPAKKTSITEKQLEHILKTIDEIPSHAEYERVTSRVIILTFINTGLRNAELCNLKLKDVDLENQRLFVHLGKGNKNRLVGITNSLKEELINYLKLRSKFDSEYFFLGRGGAVLDHGLMWKRLNRIAKRAKIDFSPHSLRRSFVTINAGKGRPLNHLRIACGHADISTTQGYCMTSQEEVIESMICW